MKYFYAFYLFLISSFAIAQHNPSSYYATNPSSQYGTSGTITIDGTITDWSNAKLIAQGVANDDPRIFKGSHEGPVYDLYALYASWDATNLYLMWQYSNVTDVSDPAQGYPISDNGKPYNINIPICIALDVDPNLQTNGLIDGTTNSVWASGTFNTFANGADHLLMFSTKPGVGQPALFKMNANGKFDYTTTFAIPFTTAGITYQYGNSFLTSTLYGINSNGGAGFVPANLSNAASYINFKTAGLGHVNTQETFYEMKIPLASLGITQSYLENYGIGAMVISTFGNSAIESLPHDNSTLDNATLSYSADASTSKEKEDADNFTAPMARIGHAYVACGVTEIPTISPASTSILIGNSVTLTASGCASGQTYKWETGQTTAAITITPSTTSSFKAKCVGTCEGAYSTPTNVTVTCTAPTEIPNVSPTAVSVTYGTSTTITASGCVSGQTYKWSSGQTTAAITVSPSATATYSAKCVSASGCEGTSSSNATVTVTGAASCTTFTWDNATTYFLLIDRFNNGSTANDAAYGRQADPAGGFMGGDFKGVTQKITEGYFDNLGVNALWITAPYEQMHGYVAGYGSDPAFQKHYAYHGYYPLDYTQPDAAYGTKNEFKAMVDSAHAHGIRIVMDIVMNHLAYDNQGDVNEYLGGFSVTDKTNAGWCNWWSNNWIRKADGYCATTPGGDDLTMSLAGLPDVKTEVTTSASSTTAGLPPLLQTKWGPSKENRLSTEVASLDSYFTRTSKPKSPRHYIIKWLTDWVRDYGVDAFRIDTYKHVGRDAWGELNDEADLALAEWKTANPTKKMDDKPFWTVGEWWGHGIGKNTEAVTTGKTDALINFTFKGAAGSPTALDATYSNYASTLNTDPTWNVLSYISSHDDGMFDRANLINAGTSLLLAPGAVQIYYGDETARPLGTVAAGTDQPTRSFMNWNSINANVLSHWQKLGKFRKAHPAVGAGSHAKIADTPYTFSRSITSSEVCGGCDKVIIVVGASGATTVNVSSIFLNGTLLKDAYTGNTATVSGGNVTFTATSNGVILIENPDGCPQPCTAPTEIPTVVANPTTINYGQNTTVTASGCAAGQTYEWETGQTTSSITVSPVTSPATYKARCVAADGCKGTLSAAATVTVNNIPALTVYFKRPASWTAVPKIYSWTGSSTAQSGVWPGTNMTLYCGNWYSYTFAAGVTNVSIIFNDGTGTTVGVNKTPDITGISAISRYDGATSMSATTMTTGIPTDCPCTPPTDIPTVSANTTVINAGQSSTLTASGCASGQTYKWETGQTTASITVTPTSTTSYKAKCVAADGCEGSLSTGTTVTVNGGNESKVYFKLPAAWTGSGAPKIHYWNVTPTNASAGNTTWPGLAMVSEGNGWYSYTFPSGTTSANIIFNNNTSPQTNDLSVSTFPAWFMSDCAGIVNSKLGTNGNWVFSDPRTTQTGSYDVFLDNTAGWTSPYAYVYPAGGSGTPMWPGTAMTLVSGSVYKVTLTNSPVCIIFNGSGGQTANLSTSNPGGTWNNGTNVWTPTPSCTIPAAPAVSASPSSILAGATSTLTASGCSGTVSWFNVATGGTALNTGNTFTTTALSTTTTFYAECSSGASCVSATRGSIVVNVCSNEDKNFVLTTNNITTSGTIKQETDGTITANNKIYGTLINVTYDSKKSVTLNPGFEINATGTNVFKAYIDGCGGN